MSAAGTVTFLTLNATFSPSTDKSGQVILMALRVIPGGVAGAAVVRYIFFASVVGYPVVTHLQFFIPEVVLGCGIRVAGDDVSIMVDEACLPVITTYHIADVIPGISFGDIDDFDSTRIGFTFHWRF